MKIVSIILLFSLQLFAVNTFYNGIVSKQPVLVGDKGIGSTVSASAVLEMYSTSKGMLAPKMTTAQRDAISPTVAGLFIYNTDTNKFNSHTGSAWEEVKPTPKDITTATAGLTITNGTGATMVGVTISASTSSASSTGLLTSTDWSLFNGKQNVISVLTPNLSFLSNTISLSMTPTISGMYTNTVQYNTGIAAPSHSEGLVFWDSTDKALAFHSDISGVTNQIGQEQWVKIVNKTGGTLANGMAVYINGAQGNRATGSYVIASDGNISNKTSGLVTNTINNNDEGYVTVNGIVRNVDTSSFTVGASIYVNPSIPGGLTGTIPTTPNHKIRIGTALNSTNNGSILVSVDTGNDINQLHDVLISSTAAGTMLVNNGSYWTTTPMLNDMIEPSGNVSRAYTISFSTSGRILHVIGSHDVYISGLKYTKPSASIAISNTDGLHLVYYNASGVLTESTSFPLFSLPFIATIYWNSSTSDYIIGDERHGITMDHDTQTYLHDTIGARYESGFAGTFLNSSFTIAAGIFHDDDIEHSIPSTSICNNLYKDGSATFSIDENQSTYYKTVTGTIQYNNGNALANVTNTNYVAYWIYATNAISNTQIVSVMGQRQDNTLANARTNNTPDTLSFGSVPFAEMKLLYRVILRNVAGTPTFIEAADYRIQQTLPGSTYVATSHLTLSDLAVGDSGHTTLALLAGRTGGQTLIGSDSTTGSLTLRGNSADTNSGSIRILDRTSSTSNTTGALILDGGLGMLGTGYIGTDLHIGGSLWLHNGVGNATILQASTSTSGTFLYRLPPSDGTNGQVLSTNGAGILSWATVYSISTKTSSYSIAASDSIILLDGSSSSVVGTLPNATSGSYAGKLFTIKAINTDNLVYVNSLGGNIDGESTYVFTGKNDFIGVVTDNSNWFIVR